ncbi:MAG TPA: cytidine deaminase [Propionibacteriaceae bacterium]|jgi:hypothetical protein
MSNAQPGDVQVPSNAEDVKIIGLARAARARTGAAQGACVRDTDGRTYAATNVALPSLTLSAIAVAVAMAVSSGATGLEAAALASEQPPAALDTAVLTEVPGAAVVIWWVDPAGVVQDVVHVHE